MKRLFKSVACALDGIRSAFKSERNFRLHLLALCLAVALGFYLRLTTSAWGFVIMSIGFVLAAELFNTAVERLGDEAAGGAEKHLIKHAKDIAAGAVLISALTALVIGVLFLFIPFVHRVF